MTFSSSTFMFAFLPLVLLLYFLVKGNTAKNIVLFIFSIFFYAWGEPTYILLMVFAILVNYYLVKAIERGKGAKAILILLIIIDLGMLFFFKYINFFVDNINLMFSISISKVNVTLPIGISFYTFQILSYVIDVYKKRHPADKSLLNFATYVSLFPQLVAGPIVRYETVRDELKNRKTELNDVIEGAERFALGLAKKVVIANSMALAVDTIFKDIYNMGTVVIWFAIICYTIQIYFDFSGYSDMAIGLGRIFGFHFLENFDYPYISKSVTEFWRRWHISLSSWFKDYVYIPLGGNRVSKGRWLFNILVVWFATGFWHGASWNYIIWGLFYGLLLVLEKFVLSKWLKKMPKIIQHIYALLIILIGWTIFRLENISELGYALKTMFVFKGGNFVTYLLEHADVTQAIFYLILGIILSTPIWKKCAEQCKKNKTLTILYHITIYAVFLYAVMALVGSTYNPFIYFRF